MSEPIVLSASLAGNPSHGMGEQEMIALFLLAGIRVDGWHELANQYWPDAYVEQRAASPWWLVETSIGRIRLGWRKRVISIHWDEAPIRAIITRDSVTKDITMVHAWGYGDAVTYLQSLAHEASRQRAVT